MKLYYSKNGYLIKWDDLTQLKNGDYLFYQKSFDNDKRAIEMSLPNLLSGRYMFDITHLESFSGDLSSLTDGASMFSSTNLNSFNINLSSLVNGDSMFSSCTKLTTFNSDLSSLVNGIDMFSNTKLTSFNANLSSLKDGTDMFRGTSLTTFNSDLSSLVNGYWMFCWCDNLASFDGKNLKKLAFAKNMFTRCKLSISSVERIAEQVFDYANMDWDSLPILYDSDQSEPSEEEIQLKDEGLYVYNDTSWNRYELYCIYGGYDETGKYYKNCDEPGAKYDKSSKTLVYGNEIQLDVDEEQAADATYMSRLQGAFDKLAAKGWDVESNISMTSAILEGDEITKDKSIYAKVETQIDENRSNEYTHIDANGNNVLLRTAKYIGPRLRDWQLFASIEDAEQHFGIRPIK